MNTQERIYIRPIVRKAKITIENIKKIIQDEDHYELSYFETNFEEFESLSEEFLGKCVLQSSDLSEVDNLAVKKNKEGDNSFCLLNQLIQQETVPSSEIRIIKQIQNQDKEDIFNSETSSDSNQFYDFNTDLYSIAQQVEIDYLEGLDKLKKLVGIKSKNHHCKKRKQKTINKFHLLPQIQQKKILKINRIA